jgi:hypothetical protein
VDGVVGGVGLGALPAGGRRERDEALLEEVAVGLVLWFVEWVGVIDHTMLSPPIDRSTTDDNRAIHPPPPSISIHFLLPPPYLRTLSKFSRLISTRPGTMSMPCTCPPGATIRAVFSDGFGRWWGEMIRGGVYLFLSYIYAFLLTHAGRQVARAAAHVQHARPRHQPDDVCLCMMRERAIFSTRSHDKYDVRSLADVRCRA